jgi:hypothetical protein
MTRQSRWWPRRGDYLRFYGLAGEQSALLGPVERQIEFGETRRGEFDGLPTLQARLDQLRAQEGEANQAPYIAPADAVTPGQFLQRSDPASRGPITEAGREALADLPRKARRALPTVSLILTN